MLAIYKTNHAIFIDSFYRKFVNESLNALEDELCKEIIQAQSKTYYILAGKLKPMETCDWDEYPEAANTKFKSLELLFFEATKYVLTENMKAAKQAKEAEKKQGKQAKSATTTKAPETTTTQEPTEEPNPEPTPEPAPDSKPEDAPES